MSLPGSVGASSIRPATGPHQNAVGPTPSRKRKDSYDYESNKPSSPTSSSSLLGRPRPPYVRQPPPAAEHTRLAKPPPWQQVSRAHHAPPPSPSLIRRSTSPPAPVKPGGNRLLVASYLAHEFLSRGTLFGRPYGAGYDQQVAANAEEVVRQKRKQQYEEVASIMWGGGVYVSGVVNPTQLGGWLQKQQEKH